MLTCIYYSTKARICQQIQRMFSKSLEYPSAKQHKIATVAFENALSAQTADLGGKAAAVHLQIIRQLLPVKRNREAAAARFFRLQIEIRQQFIPRGTLGSNLQLLMKENIFLCQTLH